jgi:AraC-like DNA-binding protein
MKKSYGHAVNGRKRKKEIKRLHSQLEMIFTLRGKRSDGSSSNGGNSSGSGSGSSGSNVYPYSLFKISKVVKCSERYVSKIFNEFSYSVEETLLMHKSHMLEKFQEQV